MSWRSPIYVLGGLVAWFACAGGRVAAHPFEEPIGPVYVLVIDASVPQVTGDYPPPGAVVFRGTSVAFEKAVLAPRRTYRLWYVAPKNKWIFLTTITTGAPGQRAVVPLPANLEPILENNVRYVFKVIDGTPDGDGDGLPEDTEFVVGTNPAVADTDGDGVNDGAEIANGTNPLDGRPAAVGIIASTDTPGNAQDVAAANGLAAIADGASGVTLFSATDALNPVRLAQVDTPGSAAAVAFGTGVLAVADGASGLAILDITDPANAAILHQVSFGTGAAVNGVATDDVTAYVALTNGYVASVDLASGTILERKKLGTVAVQDVALGNEVLYTLVPGTLYVVDLHGGTMGAATSVAAAGGVGAGGKRLRLTFGGDRLYTAHTLGVNVFSLANPLAPVLLKSNITGQGGWKQLVPNGSGLGLGAVGVFSTDTGAHDLSLYGLETNGTLTFRTTIVTPGITRAVAGYNGLAYVADGANGLEVINYLAPDSLHQAPTIALDASFALAPAGSAQAEEGKTARVTATVTDDVQVRNVEFLIDGAIASSDGGFPFELRFTTPVRGTTKQSFTLQARAFDTGGNMAATPVYTIALVADATPPRVVRMNPANTDIAGPIDSVLVNFSEPLDLPTVTPTTLELRSFGPDRIAGTVDDVVLNPPIFSWRETTNAVALGFAAPLAPGVYRVTAGTDITDLAGNHLVAPVSSTFTIFSQADRDRDGVPDDLETALGLDPDNPDTDGDGIPDGKEDFDSDGLANAAEIVVGTDPKNADTNGNGINDADEDADGDGLTNKQEAAAGTDITKADTDGDGWNDETEVIDGTDPRDTASRPPRFVVRRSLPLAISVLHVDASAATGVVAPGAIEAQPPISVIVLRQEDSDFATARPPIAVVVLSSQPTGNSATEPNLTVAKPPVNVEVLAP